jgi:hypothetical protein
VSAVQQHHCGAWVYELRGPDGPLVLETVSRPDGVWVPGPDGRSVHHADYDEDVHNEHRCVPEGQGTLL